VTAVETPSLFDQVPTEEVARPVPPPAAPSPVARRARRSDPQTSHDAAASIAPVLHVELRRVLAVLEGLHASERYEATTGAINRVLGDRQRNCTARRITDLVDRGLVRDSGRTHREERKGARTEIVWEPVSKHSDAPATMGGESVEPGPHAPGLAPHVVGGSDDGVPPASSGAAGSTTGVAS
jgi:hypothetical protein